jgi:uncharacterized RDD family membrane protein YckC
MALVTCSECQSQVSDRAVSCPQCGNVFSRCPECKNEVRAGEAACKNCGYPLGLPVTAPAGVSASTYSSQLLPANTGHFVPDGVATAVIYAGFWRRFAAAFIDGIIVLIVLAVADVVLGAIVGNPSSAYGTLSSALWLGFSIAYYVGQEASQQQATLGKRALGIIVTDLHGNRISSGRAVGRYFAKFLSTITLLIGYVMAGFTEKKQALHDMIAGTLVVVKPTNR